MKFRLLPEAGLRNKDGLGFDLTEITLSAKEAEVKKSASLFAALMLVALVGACSKEKKETTTTTTTTTTEVKTTGDSIGVPECDEYIAKYEKCIGDKVPEMARGAMQEAFTKTRASWKELAANDATKGSLASACKQAMEASKTALSAYGCEM